jgi:hypothetical protein
MKGIVIRCGTPDCDWGYRVPDLIDPWITKCYAAFREHCIEWHQLDPDDTERFMQFDLVEFILALV